MRGAWASTTSSVILRGAPTRSLILLLAGALAGAWSQSGRAASLPDTIDAIRPSIVAVGTIIPTRRPPGIFLATGFVVGDGRHVITNAHAIPDELDYQKQESLAVLVHGDKRALRVELVSKDLDHDVALLKIIKGRLPAMSLDAKSKVREGELYAFTGFPIGEVLGLKPVTHRGIVSSITPIATPQLSSGTLDVNLIRKLRSPYEVLQLDATAYPGNSGSPLYHPDTGRVVGIINRVFVKETKENVLEKPSGITYAIPVVYAKKLLEAAGIKAN